MFKKLLLLVVFILFALPQTFAADLLDFVPNEAGLVIRANIQQIVSIPEVKAKIDEAIGKNENEYIKQVKETGFDPYKDIHSVVMFLPLENMQKKDMANTHIALVAEGKFNVEKTIDAIKANNGLTNKLIVAEEDGMKTITFLNEKGNAKMVFFDESTVLVGTVIGVARAKAVRQGKAPSVKTNKDFATAIAKLNQNATLAATVALPDDARKYLEANENVKTLSTIQFLSLDLTKTTDVDINIIGEFAPKTDMAAVTKLLTQFGDAAKTTKAPYGVLVDFAKNYKVTSEGLTAKISSLVTKASLEKLVETKGAPEQK